MSGHYGPPGPQRPPLGPPVQPAGPGRPGAKKTPVIVAFVVVFLVVFLLVGVLFVRNFLLPQFQRAAGEPTTPAGQASSMPRDLTGHLRGAGSAGAVDAVQQWASVLTAGNPDLRIDFTPTGGSEGIDAVLAGEATFAVADRPVSSAEYRSSSACLVPPISLPITGVPLVIVAQLPGVTELVLDAPTLAAIYTGELTNWSDPRIGTLNPDQTFPDLAITTVYRSDENRHSRILSTWLQETGAWELGSATEWPADTGVAADGVGGVTNKVVTTVGAIGYLPLSHLPTDVNVARLVNGDRAFAPDGPEATYQLDGSPKVPGRSSIDQARQLDPTITGAYPLLEVHYLVVCEEYADKEQAALVKEVFGWILAPEGHAEAVPVGTQPFSGQLYEALAAAITTIT